MPTWTIGPGDALQGRHTGTTIPHLKWDTFMG